MVMVFGWLMMVGIGVDDWRLGFLGGWGDVCKVYVGRMGIGKKSLWKRLEVRIECYMYIHYHYFIYRTRSEIPPRLNAGGGFQTRHCGHKTQGCQGLARACAEQTGLEPMKAFSKEYASASKFHPNLKEACG